ncbi:MAG: BlaI/MecI/CopY family transcriptional regulator [Microbacteriaceae bacterium]|nr:BlaI/MecI/CopY family transcriptional regulator [Microbacteriaceae bacterium]
MAGEVKRERGELESSILKALWNSTEAIGASEIQAQISNPTPAYTTVLTVLDRLEAKGLVERSGTSPRKVKFTATKSSEDLASATMIDALEDVLNREEALLKFAGNLSKSDIDLLSKALGKRKK